MLIVRLVFSIGLGIGDTIDLKMIDKAKKRLLLRRAAWYLAMSLCLAVAVFIVNRSFSVSVLIGATYFLYSVRGLYSYYIRLRGAMKDEGLS